MSTLAWEDIEATAKEAFSIWVDQPELAWARQAWDLLAKAGLTQYANELERCEVSLRFLALAGFYHDFCDAAFEEPSAAFLNGTTQTRRDDQMPSNGCAPGADEA